MKASRIHYFDNNATTSVAPEVVEAMLPYLTQKRATLRSGLKGTDIETLRRKGKDASSATNQA